MAENKSKQQAAYNSVFDLPAKSWELVWKNWQMFAVVNIFMLVNALIYSLQGTSRSDVHPESAKYPEQILGPVEQYILELGAALFFAFVVVNIFLMAMSIVLQIKSSKGKQPGLQELASEGGKYWLKLFILYILIILLVVGGLILLIIPGLFAITRLAMAPYAMVDKNLGIIEAMKESNRLTKDRADKVWAAIGIALLIAFGAGVISTLPYLGPIVGSVAFIAYSLLLPLRYLELRKATNTYA